MIKFQQFTLIFLVFLSSCADRKRVIKCGEDLKFVVSTDYDWFESHESYYYELITTNREQLINKSWFMARGYKDVKLSDYSSICNDSFAILMDGKFILAAYNLSQAYELDREEFNRILLE